VAQRATRSAVAIGTAIVAVAAVWFARGHWDTVYDDALIYLRYVRNLHAGCGLSFNCGEAPVEAFTSPLYLAVLWVGSLLTAHWIDLTQIIGVGCLIAAGGLAVATAAALAADPEHPSAAPVAESERSERGEGGGWARATGRAKRGPVAALATAMVLALDPFVLLNANTGMETAMAAAVVALIAYAAVTRRPRLLVASAVLCTLLRPEGLLFVLALPLVERRWRYLAVAAAGVLAITAVRYAIFGDVLPNTYYAKSGGTWRHAELGLAYIAEAIRDFPICVVAVLAWRRAPYLLAVAGVWLAFFVRTGGDTFAYSRLWFPLVPALTAVAIAELARLARYRRELAAAAPAVAIAVATRAAIVHAIPRQGTSPRVLQWAAIGTYLRAHEPRNTLIATVPIGAIGYYSSLPILDEVGLADRTIAHAGRSVPAEYLTKLWIGHERNDVDYVVARAPAVVVTTMVSDAPWTLAGAKVGFWAEWLLLQEIRAGRAPYHVRDLEVTPGTHVLAFERD
jgi:hypothetical protein